jgi:hypothetical protein
LQGRYLRTEQYKQRLNAHRYKCLEWDFEPTIPAFERAKTVHALDRAATVVGQNRSKGVENKMRRNMTGRRKDKWCERRLLDKEGIQ